VVNNFSIWFSTGLEHILDPGGSDHILYVSLLALAYPSRQWRKLLILVTGFTIGHSLSLALSVTTRLHLPRSFIEFAIALSILATAVYQLYWTIRSVTGNKIRSEQSSALMYASAGIFGLIHGLGFSFLLRAMLGSANNVILPLLYFNLGLETGQLIIVTVILLFSLFLAQILKWPFQAHKTVFICFITLIAFILCAHRFFQLF
jgi:hypothetical protein